jgi:hypothetical protein
MVMREGLFMEVFSGTRQTRSIQWWKTGSDSGLVQKRLNAFKEVR